MKRSMLPKLAQQRVRLRPIAQRFDENGRELDELDDDWFVEDVTRDRISLLNTRTSHSLRIGTDHILEYLSGPGDQSPFLILKSQVLLEGKNASVEPLNDRGKAIREEIDEALRLAKGMVIEGGSSLSELGGESAGIAISAFSAWIREANRRIGYNSGSIVGLAHGTTYYVYAIDPDRKGGAVPYMATVIRQRALAGHEKLYIGRLRTSRKGSP